MAIEWLMEVTQRVADATGRYSQSTKLMEVVQNAVHRN
jgi:hypothetical protein